MAQDDQSVANGNGATVRADINANFQALVTNSSGATAPSTTWPYQWWFDTTNNLLKQRNGANTAWGTVASWDGTDWIPYRAGVAIPALGTAATKDTGKDGGDVPTNDDLTVNRSVTGLAAANTTAETTLYSYTVPGGVLGTDRMLRLAFLGDYLNNSGGTTTLTIRVKYGATTIAAHTVSSISTAATRRPMNVHVELSANGATGAQVARVITEINAANAADGVGANLTPSLSLHNAVVEDSTADKALQVTVQHSTASASIEARRRAAHMELI